MRPLEWRRSFVVGPDLSVFFTENFGSQWIQLISVVFSVTRFELFPVTFELFIEAENGIDKNDNNKDDFHCN